MSDSALFAVAMLAQAGFAQGAPTAMPPQLPEAPSSSPSWQRSPQLPVVHLGTPHPEVHAPEVSPKIAPALSPAGFAQGAPTVMPPQLPEAPSSSPSWQRSPQLPAVHLGTPHPEVHAPEVSPEVAPARSPAGFAQGAPTAMPPQLPEAPPSPPNWQRSPQLPAVHLGTPHPEIHVPAVAPAVAPAVPIAPAGPIAPRPVAPRSNSELYYQRLAALRAGKLYTRLPSDSFAAAWQGMTQKPTYAQWRRLLAAEARAVAGGQGNNDLAVLVGDSISLWYPSDRLPRQQLWLNQSISGETTRGVLNRLSDFAAPRAQTIYVLAGVNDLKNGFSNAEILGNMRAIMLRLRQLHPRAQIIVQSILPTQSPLIPNQRIADLNQQLAAIAQQSGVSFLNLHDQFTDANAHLRPELTTDGIHLTALGYAIWQEALQQTALVMARNSWYATRQKTDGNMSPF
jgi:lysophospholipase L1-like esterase